MKNSGLNKELHLTPRPDEVFSDPLIGGTSIFDRQLSEGKKSNDNFRLAG
jgi:hypothetical protein